MLNEQYSVETEEKILKIVRAVSLIMKINTGNSHCFICHIFRVPLLTPLVVDGIYDWYKKRCYLPNFQIMSGRILKVVNGSQKMFQPFISPKAKNLPTPPYLLIYTGKISAKTCSMELIQT